MCRISEVYQIKPNSFNSILLDVFSPSKDLIVKLVSELPDYIFDDAGSQVVSD